MNRPRTRAGQRMWRDDPDALNDILAIEGEAEDEDDWRAFAILVADTCNDPHLVHEAERRLRLSGA